MKFYLRLLLWQVPRASHIQGHFNFNAKILVLCRKKRNREEIDFISLSMILVLFVLFYMKDTQTAFWTNFHETIRGYHKNSFLLSLVNRLFSSVIPGLYHELRRHREILARSLPDFARTTDQERTPRV